MAAPDNARAVLSDPRAPEDERFDAQAELHRTFRPTARDVTPILEAIQESLHDAQLAKAAGVIPFPGQRNTTPSGSGMRSVAVDSLASQVSGDWYEKVGVIGFDHMRRMVEGTPILSSIVLTRIRQVQRFCAVSEDGGLGFAIKHRDKEHEATPEETKRMAELGRFFSNCGWEFNPRKRKALRRDNFSSFMARLTRNTLTYDAAPIETESKRRGGIDGLYAVEGSSVRLCAENGYEGDADVFAIQLVQGRVATTYTAEDLIYEVRNPTTALDLGGYGYSECELLVRTVTSFLNAMQYNAGYFSENSVPKGLLQISGEYSAEDMAAFKRHWKGMVSGIEGRHSLPVMASKDSEAKATYTPLGQPSDEMAYSKWIILLTSIACAIYGMDPAEISFDSFSAQRSSLSGSDTEEKLTQSKDKGLRPLLSYFQNTLSDFVVADFDPDLVFRWEGLDPEDAEKEWEAKKLILTVDELRAERGYEPSKDENLGSAPLNPSLIGPWLQLNHPPEQPQGADFGGQGGDEEDFGGDEDGQDGGAPTDAGGGDEEPGPDALGPPEGEFGAPPEPGKGDFGKALELSAIYHLGGKNGL